LKHQLSTLGRAVWRRHHEEPQNRHAMVTKVRGSFTEFEGKVHLDEQSPAQ
jgi:polyisoprenoid-binding protein YceI